MTKKQFMFKSEFLPQTGLVGVGSFGTTEQLVAKGAKTPGVIVDRETIHRQNKEALLDMRSDPPSIFDNDVVPRRNPQKDSIMNVRMHGNRHNHMPDHSEAFLWDTTPDQRGPDQLPRVERMKDFSARRAARLPTVGDTLTDAAIATPVKDKKLARMQVNREGKDGFKQRFTNMDTSKDTIVYDRAGNQQHAGMKRLSENEFDNLGMDSNGDFITKVSDTTNFAPIGWNTTGSKLFTVSKVGDFRSMKDGSLDDQVRIAKAAQGSRYFDESKVNNPYVVANIVANVARNNRLMTDNLRLFEKSMTNDTRSTPHFTKQDLSILKNNGTIDEKTLNLLVNYSRKIAEAKDTGKVMKDAQETINNAINSKTNVGVKMNNRGVDQTSLVNKILAENNTKGSLATVSYRVLDKSVPRNDTCIKLSSHTFIENMDNTRIQRVSDAASQQSTAMRNMKVNKFGVDASGAEQKYRIKSERFDTKRKGENTNTSAEY